jgi:DNA-binding PadR family transcriptional regulator
LTPICDLFYIVTMNDALRGTFETTVLATVAALGDGASGLDIRRVMAERTGRTHAVGAIYTVLQRLEAKGFVMARVDEPRAMRGGRARRLFTVTGTGARALDDFRRRADVAWGLPVVSPV